MLRVFLAGAFALLMAISPPVLATAQEPDILVLDGERLALHTNPLTPLIKAKRITLPEPDVIWSGNWRGYVAHWSITGDRMVLSRIGVLYVPEGAAEGESAVPVNVLAQVFPEQDEVLAEWFSGTLIIPRGNLVKYVHMGYGSTYERYTILHIQSGMVVSREDLSADEYRKLRKERFAAYQKTSEYEKKLKDSRKKLSRRQAEDFLYQYDVEQYMSITPQSE